MICSLCQKDSHDILYELDSLVISLIKKHNPQWVEEDGSCQKCVDYYNNFKENSETLETN